MGGFVELVLGEGGHVRGLGEKLAEQSIGVLVRPALPRRLGVNTKASLSSRWIDLTVRPGIGKANLIRSTLWPQPERHCPEQPPDRRRAEMEMWRRSGC